MKYKAGDKIRSKKDFIIFGDHMITKEKEYIIEYVIDGSIYITNDNNQIIEVFETTMALYFTTNVIEKTYDYAMGIV